jgi:hypothetical protein
MSFIMRRILGKPWDDVNSRRVSTTAPKGTRRPCAQLKNVLANLLEF